MGECTATQGPADRPAQPAELLEAVLASVPAGVVLFESADLTVRWANRAFHDFLDEAHRGRSLVGARLVDFAPEATEAGLLEMLRRVARSGTDESLDEREYHGFGHRLAWWRWSAHAIPTGRGLADVLFSATDITDLVLARRNAEHLALQAREAERVAQASADRLARLQAITAALSSSVTMKDVASVVFEKVLEPLGAHAVGIVWMLRPGSLELVFGHGLTEEEFRMLDDAARAGARMPIRDAILSRRPVWAESPEEIRERYPVLDGLRARRGECAFGVVPLVLGEHSPGVIGFTFDRPRRFAPAERAFMEALAQLCAQAFERARLFEAERGERSRAAAAETEAKRIARLQEQLMAVVGHDLRTPLSSIHMATDVLFKRGELSAAQALTLGRIAHSAARMSAIIRDLLDLSRARRGLAISIHPSPIDLAEVCQRSLLEFEELGAAERIALAAQGKTTLEADPARLSQVISNLVGNALQHGGGTPVRIQLSGEEGAVVLSVHNDGPPIVPEMLPHIFEPFRRGHARDPAGEPRDSVGLGLFIVREIVAAHGGTVQAASSEAEGTTFTVRLPRVARQAARPRTR